MRKLNVDTTFKDIIFPNEKILDSSNKLKAQY
jgi:hypothetical protein